MKRILVSIMALFLLSGCASMQPANFDQAMLLMREAANLAEKQGVAYTATARWNGDGGVYWVQGLQVATGVTMEVSFHGNAASERTSSPVVVAKEPEFKLTLVSGTDRRKPLP